MSALALAAIISLTVRGRLAQWPGPRQRRETRPELHNSVFTSFFFFFHNTTSWVLELQCPHPRLFIRPVMSLFLAQLTQYSGSWGTWSETGLNINTTWRRPHRSSYSTPHMIQLKTFPHALSGTLVKNMLLQWLKINLILIYGDPDKQEAKVSMQALSWVELEKKKKEKQREMRALHYLYVLMVAVCVRESATEQSAKIDTQL